MAFKLHMKVDVCMPYAHVRLGGLDLVLDFLKMFVKLVLVVFFPLAGIVLDTISLMYP